MSNHFQLLNNKYLCNFNNKHDEEDRSSLKLREREIAEREEVTYFAGGENDRFHCFTY
jgi:large subunit ribosomal protein L17e